MEYANLKKRYIGLDLFRIMSVIAVCAFHTTIHLKANYFVLQSVSQMGAIFMTAFFMLSGFSLFVNYAGTNIVKITELKTFLIKRIIGIIPMYYITSLIYIIINYSKDTAIEEILLAPIEILCIQSVFSSLFNFSHNGGTWFISCIMMCYLVYPLLQEVIKQLFLKVKITAIIICAFILLYSPIIVLKLNISDIYSNPFFRILEFTIGILLASLKPELENLQFVNKYIYNKVSILIESIVLVVGITCAVKLGIGSGNYAAYNFMLYNWICLPFFIFILLGLSGIDSKLLSKSRIISYFCDISYVFFLAQQFSNDISRMIIEKYAITNNYIIIGLGWGSCIGIAIALHEIFERPITRALKKKI